MRIRVPVSWVVWCVAVAACAGPTDVPPAASPRALLTAAPTAGYIVELRQFPADLNVRVAAMGGTVTDRLVPVTTAILAGLTVSDSARIAAWPEVIAVTRDELISVGSPLAAGPRVRAAAPPIPRPLASPTTAAVYAWQWNLPQIHADQAWVAGKVGTSDVVIADIDTGVDDTRLDLIGRVDHAHSRSFVDPAEDALVAALYPGHPAWTDLIGHGTWTSSVASSNGILTAGVTQGTTIYALKALSYFTLGSSIPRAIVYAADNHADVINLSLGGVFAKRLLHGRLLRLFNLLVRYAIQKGTLVVASAGNSFADLDHDVDLTWDFCTIPGVLCVSATGPTDSGPDGVSGPFLNPDAFALYSNFGRSAIGVAAPGGNIGVDQLGNFFGASWVWGTCASTDIEIINGQILPGPCSSGGFTLSGGIGTSASAPHVSGLAALLVGRIGHGHPAQLQQIIQGTADDLGAPGTDPYYGKGRINVARALGL